VASNRERSAPGFLLLPTARGWLEQSSVKPAHDE